MRWSELLRSDPVRVEIELAKLGITLDDLVRDGFDDPEARPILRKLTSKDAQRQFALEWFGDQGHPQPTQREPRVLASFGHGTHVYADPTPDWGRLPQLDDGRGEAQPAKSKKPRHRPPDPIERDTVKQLMWELRRREASPSDPELTQEKIAARVGLTRSRVQQAETLQRAGWDLLRTQDEFSAEHEFVRWPSVREAVEVLASERAEN